MMVARWHVRAKYGYKQTVIDLLKEWQSEIGPQAGLDVSKEKILVGSVGACESEIQSEIHIQNLTELDQFFDKLAKVKMHNDWGKQLSDHVVSGSNYWEVFRVVE
ncbi:hypothetical protein [Pseudothioclava arenosa]|uniref:Uncharacterized protein n=1 Tax=Pseudothioclava arenosa TaxID=1795308 RepID=A0A2A4CNN2_9RHOB|nr:hypothetical protein [Pseudothioclava arenosa]PCD75736.1 hypothetical protein CLN94_12570 [Pseudothioclava arenosa]